MVALIKERWYVTEPVSRQLYLKNREGKSRYDISEFYSGRRPGLSAMLRLGNEEDWIEHCVESILPWFDELVCTLQCSEDATEWILRAFKSPKIKIHRYPFLSYPNGPGHNKQPRGSVYERAYFYNWSLSLTQNEWVSKWDGDMVAHDWLGEAVHSLIGMGNYDVICMAGANIVHGLKHKSRLKPATANEPRFFKVMPGVFYYTSEKCEDIHHPSYKTGKGFGEAFDVSPGDRTYMMPKHGYLHFKHAKPDHAATMAWPENWSKSDHFKRIYDYSEPGDRYRGEIPTTLKEIMC